MTGMTLPNDPFPPSEFDDWAETYDTSVATDRFPFIGYDEVLTKIIALAEPHPGLSVLDLGTGTGNLALSFAQKGCDLWCTDFSVPMLEKARNKIPSAHFVQHDLRLPVPAELLRPFDRILSAYVFHHFDLEEKVRILRALFPILSPGGRIIIGDIAFQDALEREKVKIAAGDEWEEEFFWLANETIPAFKSSGMKVEYTQVSTCAGIFVLRSPDLSH